MNPVYKKDIKSKLILVEDDINTVSVIKLYIGNKYDIDWVVTGEELLLKSDENDYDGFLIDIGLPGALNGIETTKRLKKIAKNKDKPFIAVTAFAMKGDREYFLSQGLTHYISKPFGKQNLLTLLFEALGN